MQKLISELTRLYLSAGVSTPQELEQHLLGVTTRSMSLLTGDDMTRAMVIPFRKMPETSEAQHWNLLCTVANALQSQLDLPAPAVSISGADGYGLWLSLETPAPTALVQQFLELLGKAYFPDVEINPDAASAPVELPPCLNQSTGKWAAFIHPGLGASFADESGLEMPPPATGQAALLENLKSISPSQFQHALNTLQQAQVGAPAAGQPQSRHASPPDGLLLKDATLEDIVRYLHAKNIEPTFRHLIPNQIPRLLV